MQTVNPFVRYYISSGSKNAMRTLRKVLFHNGRPMMDEYICNLCRDFDDATVKARGMIGTAATLESNADELNPWGADMVSPWDAAAMDDIENGVMPFGKHKGLAIPDMNDGYVKFWVQQSAESRAGAALIQAFTDLANDRGLFDLWEKQDAAIAAKKAASNFVGHPKERRDFILTIKKVIEVNGYYGTSSLYICEDDNENAFIYIGNAVFGEEGETLECMATIKTHKIRDGVNQTVITRPKLLSPKPILKGNQNEYCV